MAAFFYDTASGRINAIEFASEKPNNETILCIHGFCCDARIFSYCGTKLSAAGYNVVSINLPGHGMSDGKKGDLDFDICIESIHQIVADLKKRSTRLFLAAHSTGCVFALWYAHQFKGSVDGLILLTPSLNPPTIKKRFDAQPNTLQFLMLLIARIFFPNKGLNVIKDFPKYVQSGGKEVAWMMRDPQINFTYSYRFIVDIFAIKSSKVSILSDIGKIPVIILHGRKDRMMYPQVSEEFFKLLQVDNKVIKVFDCDHWYYDAIFYDQSVSGYSEESRMEVISTIVNWLKTSLESRGK